MYDAGSELTATATLITSVNNKWSLVLANVNKVILIGRCTRDADSKTMPNGGMMTNIGFVVNNSKKVNGQWENDPCYLDIDVFDRGDTGKLATMAGERCKKGANLYVEGKLKMDSWDDKTTGQKRTKLKIIADVIQYLDARPQDGEQPKANNGWGNQQKRPVHPSEAEQQEDSSIPF